MNAETAAGFRTSCLRMIAVMVVATVCAGARASPLDPIVLTDWRHDPSLMDFSINAEHISYNAATDVLTYSYAAALSLVDGPGPAVGLQAKFDWSAGIAEDGTVTDGGAVSLKGDFGAGYELLATGEVRDVGFAMLGPGSTFHFLQVLFHFDFLAPVMSRFGKDVMFEHSQSFESFGAGSNPFQYDFGCPSPQGNGSPSAANPVHCQFVSFSGLYPVSLPGGVPEPGSAGLALLALGALAALSRRQSQPSQGI